MTARLYANAALAALATAEQCERAAENLKSLGTSLDLPDDVLTSAIKDLERRAWAGRIAERVKAGSR